MNAKEFLEKARAVHGRKYRYDLPELITWKQKIRITCNKHGTFEQNATNHISGKRGCTACGRDKTMVAKRLDTQTFIKKAKAVHRDTYDYSQTKYTGHINQIDIICRIHGKFSQKANNHLNGKGCKKCASAANGAKKRVDWVRDEDLLDLLPNNFTLIDCRTEFAQNMYAKIECPKHGKVSTSVAGICEGVYCCKCEQERKRAKLHESTLQERQDEFIANAKTLFGDKYSYEKVKYVRATRAVTLVCKLHGDFKISPNCATSGYTTGEHNGSICPVCNRSSKKVVLAGKEFVCRGFEDHALRFLNDKGVNMLDVVTGNGVPVIQTKFRMADGHIARKHLPDIYLPKLNTLVEVKSSGTFGLTTYHRDGDELVKWIQHKSKAAKKAGYKYVVMLFKQVSKRNVKRIKLPSGWDSMSTKALRKWWAGVS